MAADDSFTKLLLHADGTNGSTAFADSTNVHTVTAHGNAQIDTSEKKFGTGSALLLAAGDYLTVPDSDDWNFGTGDFTIDFWTYLGDVTGSRPFIWQEDGDGQWLLQLSLGTIHFSYVDTGLITRANYSATHMMSNNRWHHISLQRSGSSIFISLDGVFYNLTVTVGIGGTAMPNFTQPLNIGGRDFALGGRMEELRVSKTLRFISSPFTPPAAPYSAPPLTAVTGTFSLSGIAAALRSVRTMILAGTSYVFTGQVARVGFTYTLAAAVGSYIYTGVANFLYRRIVRQWLPKRPPRLVKLRQTDPTLED